MEFRRRKRLNKQDVRDLEHAYGTVMRILHGGQWAMDDSLAGTPARVARWLTDFITYDPGNTDTTFEAVVTDQLVTVHGVQVWSLCEHHLLPFSVTLSMGYLTGDKVIGLSKMPRIAHDHAHRLQLQERLVHGIADDLQRITGSEHVAVVGDGVHLCQVMRGIRTPGTMSTSVLRGSFRTHPDTRAEFMELRNAR